MPVQAQPGDIAGWVEPDAKTLVVPTAAFRLDRAGKAIAYPEAGLHACDRLTLLDDKATVRVRLASNLRMQLDAETPGLQLEIPCTERGILASVAAALRAMLGGTEQRKQRVAALTRSMAPLTVPALATPPVHIVAGRRALYLAWTGGVGPFTVTMVRASDGRELTSQANIASHSVVLPAADFEPAQYTIWVRNRSGQRIEGMREDGIVVVAPGTLPALPEVLRSPGLSDEARTLFYADYLAALDDGRWTMEALQRVAALPVQSPPVRQWLLRYGGRD